MYDASQRRNAHLSWKRRSTLRGGGSTFTPPPKRIPPPPASNSPAVKNELPFPSADDFDRLNRCRDIRAERCAPALQILIIFYRLFGFSFSGVLFVSSSSSNNKSQQTEPEEHLTKGKPSRPIEVWLASSSADLKKKSGSKSNFLKREPSTTEPKRASFLLPLRLALLLYNLLILSGYLVPVITDHLPLQTARRLILAVHGADDPYDNNSTARLRPMNFGEYFARTGDDLTSVDSSSTDEATDSFAQLKPVMRTIVRSLVAVFFLEGAVSFAHSLLFGGRLLRRLAAISTQDLDARALQGRAACSRRHAVAVISILLCAIPLLMSAGLAVFDQQFNVSVNRNSSASSFFTASRLKKLAIHWWHFIALSTYSTLFVVSMLMVGGRLREMTAKVQAASAKKKNKFQGSFGEAELAALYRRVEALEGHFGSLVGCFSLPVAFTLAASTFSLIGAVCFLMISPDRSYASFIASIGLFALLRMFVVASAGNLASAAYGRLLRTVYEAMDGGGGDQGENEGESCGDDLDWSVDAWLLFGELRRLKGSFRVTFAGGTFTISQSAILTLLGFSLQYIVILLQSENYDGSSGVLTLNTSY